jgi:[CysO sulfur-carrier protein]-S-L-cysteine hydrolase
VLLLPADIFELMVAHCLDGYPLEACGLLAGVGEQVTRGYPTGNAAASSRVYTVEPRDQLRADLDAEAHGAELIGVWHSHTHTDAYPSPTDIKQAPDPGWHYVIISLRDVEPVLRSYRVIDATVTEEPVEVQ